MGYNFAICNSLEDAETLNAFILDLYLTHIENANMKKWCDIVKHKDQNKWAVNIMPEWIGMYESPVVVEYATDLDGWLEEQDLSI
jgi:hypothetical protein